MKYLVVPHNVTGLDTPFCFFAPITHVDAAQMLKANGYGWPLSAAFIDFEPDGTARTFGHSTSLGMGPRPIDAALISAFRRATLQLASPSAQR